MAFADGLTRAHCISLETFRRDGRGVRTPVWPVPLAGRLYVSSGAGGWKVVRIRANPRVRIAECTDAGHLLGDWCGATAGVVDDADRIRQVNAALTAKYGLSVGELSDDPGERVVLELAPLD